MGFFGAAEAAGFHSLVLPIQNVATQLYTYIMAARVESGNT
jgi:hypothetical protein